MHEHENVFITAILVGLLISMLLVEAVLAQAAPVPVDLAKAKFAWTWEQGTGGMAERWLIGCGPTTGTYTTTKEIPGPTVRQVAMNQVVTAEGTYFCAIQAANVGGTSGFSPEVSFRAVKVPGTPTAFQVLIP